MRQPDAVRSAIVHVRTPLYLNAYALMASNLLTSALGLVYWSLAARLYRVEDLGVSSAVISSIAFLSGLSQLNLRVALIRLVPEAGAGTTRLVAFAYAVSLVVTAVLGLMVFGAMAALHAPTLAIDGLATPIGVVGLVVATLCWTCFNLEDGVLAGLRRTVWVPVENGLFSAGKIVLLVLLAGALPALGILVSWFAAMLAVVVVVTIVLAVRWLPAHVAAHPERVIAMGRDQLLRFVAADYVGSLFALAVSGLLPVLIVAASGAREGAYFYIVWTISTSLDLLPVNICASLTVEALHDPSDLAPQVRRVALHMARLLIPLVVGVIVFADWILRIFGADYAENGTVALRLLALGALPFAVTTLFMATARIRGRGREILVTQAAVAALTLGGSAALLGPAGVAGVAAAWLGAQTIVAAVVAGWRLKPLLRSPSPG